MLIRVFNFDKSVSSGLTGRFSRGVLEVPSETSSDFGGGDIDREVGEDLSEAGIIDVEREIGDKDTGLLVSVP